MPLPATHTERSGDAAALSASGNPSRQKLYLTLQTPIL